MPEVASENIENTIPSQALHEDEAPVNSLFFQMMRAVMHKPHSVQEMESLPLAQLRLLWAVYHAGDAPMKDFSDRLEVSQSTVTQSADKLVRRGLIERIADPNDRRVVRLKMSETGRTLLNETAAENRVFMRSVWDAMSEVERASVVSGMETFIRHAEQVREKSGHPLPAWGEHPKHSGGESNSDSSSTAQPVLDLMSRRVRGRVQERD